MKGQVTQILNAIEQGDSKAADELLDSKYAKQVGRRALFNAEELRKCQEKPQKTTKPIQD